MLFTSSPFSFLSRNPGGHRIGETAAYVTISQLTGGHILSSEMSLLTPQHHINFLPLLYAERLENLLHQYIYLYFFFCIPSYTAGVHLFWVRFFCICDDFLKNPTIEVATSHLCGWCTLGVFLLPSFTSLGHECQDLLMECMCAQTRPQFILSSQQVLGNGIRAHVNSKGKVPSTRGSEEG